MSRWEPNARGRLEQAALALYGERGYEKVTVAEIAARAGLTERTFFRHYADKREVLFDGSNRLQQTLLDAVAGAPPGQPPIELVGTAIAALGALFDAGERRELARQRQAVIDRNPELQERELVKLARLGAALTDALHEHGIPVPAASLAAQIGMAVFRVTFVRWLDGAARRSFAELAGAAFDELREMTSRSTPPTART
ncbi:TetR family transcriptional regulator [Actinocatenispora thailandica]|uniref:TetR family transcriptional regulator n=1 Tax=Actinocatenispora thailandica TaxID=227318 RepID=A0A7R7HYW1_9ACTN|nr:TetR/AcrR family transcriptional regulator [Actinocatenispora thailandica]BCJ36488.1 TetR family transcriptional regulator [Actinocatenispora thailandica]